MTIPEAHWNVAGCVVAGLEAIAEGDEPAMDRMWGQLTPQERRDAFLMLATFVWFRERHDPEFIAGLRGALTVARAEEA